MFLPDATSQSFAYVENVFRQSKFGTIKDLRVNDTIIMASDGVTDNIGNAFLASLVSKAYKEFMSPQDLADEIVAEALTAAHQPRGKPDDTTVVVAYLFRA